MKLFLRGPQENQTAVLINGLLQSDLDAVFIRLGQTDTEDLRMRVLSEEPLLAALPARHPAARNAKLNLANLRDEAFVMFPRELNPSEFDAVVAACRKSGFEPTLGPSVPQFVSVVHLVAAEVGVSLVPAALQNLHIKGVVFRELQDVSLTSRLSLLWRRTDPSPFLKNFLACAHA